MPIFLPAEAKPTKLYLADNKQLSWQPRGYGGKRQLCRRPGRSCAVPASADSAYLWAWI